MAYPEPRPRRRVWPWIVLTSFIVIAVGFAGCVAFVDSTVKAFDEQASEVRSITYQAESDGRTITVMYDTSTPGGFSTATATGVQSGWTMHVQQSGILGPHVTVSLDPESRQLGQRSGTVTCRILSGDTVVKEASSSGEFASVSCHATAHDIRAAR
jgi:hypothetical protein